MLSAKQVIEQFQLQPLDQEGGYFRKIWSSGTRLENSIFGDPLPQNGKRETASLIHFLLTENVFSAMHRLVVCEHWFYHLGDPMELLLLHPDGSGETKTLGPNLENGHAPYIEVPAGSWQGARLLPHTEEESCGYTLLSCVVVPAFEWEDFELGDASELINDYPEYSEPIKLRTRAHSAQGER